MGPTAYGAGHCGVPDCARHTPRGYPMCRSHWLCLPQWQRVQVFQRLRRLRAGVGTLAELREAQEAAVTAIQERPTESTEAVALPASTTRGVTTWNRRC